MPSFSVTCLLAVLISASAWADQPWESNEHSWLIRPAAPPLASERTLRAPEAFARIQADGNFVPPQPAQGEAARLLEAAERQDVGTAKALLESGVSPNARDYWGDSPLMAAVRYDNVELVQMLLDAGALPNIKGRGYTPLGLAAKNGNVRLVEMLLRAGADPDRKSDDGDTPMHGAALMGQAQVIDALAKAAPDLTLFNREGQSPLAVAAANGQYDAVSALVRAGAPLEWGDKKFRPPLWWAFSAGDFDMARLLLKLGAAPGLMPVETLQ